MFSILKRDNPWRTSNDAFNSASETYLSPESFVIINLFPNPIVNHFLLILHMGGKNVPPCFFCPAFSRL